MCSHTPNPIDYVWNGNSNSTILKEGSATRVNCLDTAVCRKLRDASDVQHLWPYFSRIPHDRAFAVYFRAQLGTSTAKQRKTSFTMLISKCPLSTITYIALPDEQLVTKIKQ